jgi:hypothetical protein
MLVAEGKLAGPANLEQALSQLFKNGCVEKQSDNNVVNATCTTDQGDTASYRDVQEPEPVGEDLPPGCYFRKGTNRYGQTVLRLSPTPRNWS